jgi:hypothetical protein
MMNFCQSRVQWIAMAAAQMTILTALCGIGVAEAQTPTASRAASPEVIAAAAWQRITTTCQENGQKITLLSLPDDALSDSYRLMAYSDAWTKYVPMQVTAADKLNGIELHGMAILGGAARKHVYRNGKEWSEWITAGPQLPDSPFQYVFGPGEHKRYFMFVMEERSHQWLFKVPHQGLDRVNLSEAIDLDALTTKKQACDALHPGTRH